MKANMLSKSKLKTWLRKHGFKPRNKTNWRNVMGIGVLSRGGRLYRFRTNQHEFDAGERGWTVDVSCPVGDFDRWANSQDHHAVPLAGWMTAFASGAVQTEIIPDQDEPRKPKTGILASGRAARSATTATPRNCHE